MRYGVCVDAEWSLEMDDKIVESAIEYIRIFFADDASGHDFYHSLRVYKTATYIAERENANLWIVKLAALLHDVDDYKLKRGNDELKNAREFLIINNLDKKDIKCICDIISEISFKGINTCTPSTIEGKIVQDADRLDSIGAIGIARTFTYGGSVGRAIYSPEIMVRENMEQSEYQNYIGTTINHFYEKLLMVKNQMNTQEGNRIAEQRHLYMEEYLRTFFCEWDCQDFIRN